MSSPTPLTGFIIHSRPYQEKRAIYAFFCRDNGLIDGVGSRGLPSFVPMNLLASGRGSLKNFKEPFLLTDNPNILNNRLPLHLQYTALYLNEILYKLLPKDDPQSELWQVYYQTLALFEIGCTDLALRCALRRFEMALFTALGLPILFNTDSVGEPISEQANYLYQSDTGFVPVVVASLPNSQKASVLTGGNILAMNDLCERLQNDLDKIDYAVIDKDDLARLSQFFKNLIDTLLDHKPLHSRQLWADLQKFSQ